MTDDDLFAFINELERLSEKANVDFIMTISRNKETVPEAIKSYLIS